MFHAYHAPGHSHHMSAKDFPLDRPVQLCPICIIHSWGTHHRKFLSRCLEKVFFYMRMVKLPMSGKVTKPPTLEVSNTRPPFREYHRGSYPCSHHSHVSHLTLEQTTYKWPKLVDDFIYELTHFNLSNQITTMRAQASTPMSY